MTRDTATTKRSDVSRLRFAVLVMSVTGSCRHGRSTQLTHCFCAAGTYLTHEKGRYHA